MFEQYAETHNIFYQQRKYTCSIISSFIQSYQHKYICPINMKFLFTYQCGETIHIPYQQGSYFDDMSSFFPCEIDDAIQYNNPKIVILQCIFHHFVMFFSSRSFLNFNIIFLSFSRFTSFLRHFFQVLLNFPVIFLLFKTIILLW